MRCRRIAVKRTRAEIMRSALLGAACWEQAFLNGMQEFGDLDDPENIKIIAESEAKLADYRRLFNASPCWLSVPLPQ